MAEADIDAIIATPDDDTTWGDHMRGAFTTVKSTRLPGIVNETIGSTRLVTGASEGSHMLTVGPWWNFGNTAAQPAGTYHLGLSWVRGGTPDTVYINVITGATTSNVYYVMYDMADDGHPTNLAYSWGPFDATAAGQPSLTGQTTTITAGMYWVGAMTPTGNGGSPTMYGGRSSILGPHRLTTFASQTVIMTYADATPRSTFAGSIRTSNEYDTSANMVAWMSGKDT